MGLTYKFDKHSRKETAHEDPPKAESRDNGIERYDEPGHIRNICFVLADGEEQFFSYNDLALGKFSPNDSQIELRFPFGNVQIKGSNLKVLFNDLCDQRVKTLSTTIDRYASMDSGEDCIITEILIDAKKLSLNQI